MLNSSVFIFLIIIYTFTRARLLCRVCYETPCSLNYRQNLLQNMEQVLNFHYQPSDIWCKNNSFLNTIVRRTTQGLPLYWCYSSNWNSPILLYCDPYKDKTSPSIPFHPERLILFWGTVLFPKIIYKLEIKSCGLVSRIQDGGWKL